MFLTHLPTCSSPRRALLSFPSSLFPFFFRLGVYCGIQPLPCSATIVVAAVTIVVVTVGCPARPIV
jgi:hypothetical protein